MNEAYSKDKVIASPGSIKAALFDFDGTISTFRQGWERVMKPLMIELIDPHQHLPDLSEQVDYYINQSTGIQTIHQMIWLKEQVDLYNPGRQDKDAWWYKEQYKQRLLLEVEGRVQAVKTGQEPRERYLIAGSLDFLEALKAAGILMYLASGTDHDDVVREASALDVAHYFTLIKGAPRRQVDCSKEAVIRSLLKEEGLQASSLLVVGDGKVEIALGAAYGAYTLGLASDEAQGQGINHDKVERLKTAGAHLIYGDFLQKDAILTALCIKGQGHE